eukprot:15454609-Alexandrium_andersonii.AAC.1
MQRTEIQRLGAAGKAPKLRTGGAQGAGCCGGGEVWARPWRALKLKKGHMRRSKCIQIEAQTHRAVRSEG